MWKPAPGDRFVIADRDMDAEVFVVSQLTIDVRETPGGPVFLFNGTTEWALDSVAQADAVWLPHEAQMRTALGPAFRRLEPLGDGWVVTVERDGRRRCGRWTSTPSAPTPARCWGCSVPERRGSASGITDGDDDRRQQERARRCDAVERREHHRRERAAAEPDGLHERHRPAPVHRRRAQHQQVDPDEHELGG